MSIKGRLSVWTPNMVDSSRIIRFEMRNPNSETVNQLRLIFPVENYGQQIKYAMKIDTENGDDLLIVEDSPDSLIFSNSCTHFLTNSHLSC